MKDILRDLFDGRIYPSEQYIPHGSDYKAKTQAYFDKRNQLEEKLDSAIVQELDNMMQAYQDVVSEDLYAMFYGGYRLGVRMILMAMIDS